MRIYQSVSTSESTRLSVLYTKRMKQTYKDGMYKILKEKKGSKKPLYSYIGWEGSRIENGIKNSITRIHSC